MQPTNAAAFQKNLNDFKIRINAADQRWRAALAPFRGTKIVAYHNSWPNFAHRYGLDIIDYVEPKPGVPPSPSHTFSLIQTMKEQKVKVIIMEPYFDKKTPQSIADRSGAKLVVLYPSVGGNPKGGTDDYFQLFDTNVTNLVNALK
jgi:ABC-type Zn uptake system ZnuABC Zn-binding protein ZnuA